MICLGPGFLSIQVYAFIQETAWTRKNLSTLHTLSTRNLSGSGKNWVYCIRSRLGTCPGPGKIEYTVYANNQEYARILKNWVHCIRSRLGTCLALENWVYYIRPRPGNCPGPDFLSILYTPTTRSMLGSWKFEYTIYALDQKSAWVLENWVYCIRSRLGICLALENLSIQLC